MISVAAVSSSANSARVSQSPRSARRGLRPLPSFNTSMRLRKTERRPFRTIRNSFPLGAVAPRTTSLSLRLALELDSLAMLKVFQFEHEAEWGGAEGASYR